MFNANRNNEGTLFRWLADYIPRLLGAQYGNQYQIVMRDCFYSIIESQLSADEGIALFGILRDDIIRVRAMVNGDAKDVKDVKQAVDTKDVKQAVDVKDVKQAVDVKNIEWNNIYDMYTLTIENPAIVERVIDIMLRYQNKLGLAIISTLEQCLKKHFLQMLTAEQRILLQTQIVEALRIGFYIEAGNPLRVVDMNQIYGQIDERDTFRIIDNFTNYDQRRVSRGRACNTIDFDKLIYYAYMTGMPIPDGINKSIRYDVTREYLIKALLTKQPGEKRAFKFERDSIPSFNIDKLRYYYVLYSLTRDQLCKALQSHFT